MTGVILAGLVATGKKYKKMDKSKFVGCQKQLKSIRDFCGRATDTGGILLVSGNRGLGKTRLVDEALNDRSIPDSPQWYDQIFGYVSNSKRRCVIREPNQVVRQIIKIDVDPYFPCSQNIEKGQSDEPHSPKIEKKEPDENILAIALIRNIVFGLTSVIDCRCNQRKHGKTMSAKLGFWGFWFNKNAVMWRNNEYMTMGVLIVPTLVTLFISFWGCREILVNSDFVIKALVIILAFLPVIAWVFLRWLDWRALQKMSDRLYALVHAEEADKSQSSIKDSKFNKLLIPIILLGLFVVFFFGLANETLEYFGTITGNSEKLLKIFKGVAATIFVMLGVVWVSSQHTEEHSKFSEKNPTWMITLLKRYLYLCHRCGIEPVLVFDELDKLEDMDKWWWSRHQNLEEQNTKPTKLDEFLLTLARLKSSLGAEFLWVLIGGPDVYSRLNQHRHNHPDGNGELGFLGTTIQQEVLVEPINFEDTKELFEKTFTGKVSEKEIKTLWLRSYGNLSTILRNHEKQNYTYHNKTENLAIKLTEIWPNDMQLDYIDFAGDSIWLEKISNDWIQSWVHAGMLVFANDLLKKRIIYKDMRNVLTQHLPETLGDVKNDGIHPAILALQSEDATLLMNLGKQIFCSYLNAKGCTNDKNGYIELNFMASTESSLPTDQ
jgi:hypothetical protein